MIKAKMYEYTNPLEETKLLCKELDFNAGMQRVVQLGAGTEK